MRQECREEHDKKVSHNGESELHFNAAEGTVLGAVIVIQSCGETTKRLIRERDAPERIS